LDKIKILYITGGRYFDNRHRKLLSVLRNLDRQKYEFSVICPENLLLLRYLKPLDIPTYVIELPGRISTKNIHLLNSLQSGEKFHIVHSFDYTSGIYSRELKKHNPGVKCIHSPQPLEYIEKEKYLSKQVKKSTEQYLSQFTDAMICETDYDRKLAIQNKYIEEIKTNVITNSVSVARFANLKKNSDLLAELGFTNDNFIIGNLANFNSSSNQRLIINSAYYQIKKYPQIKFLLIGEGKNLAQMIDYAKQAGLEENIVFINEKQNIEDYYSIIDIFVLADKWAGSSTVLLEAMASRLPIVCSITSSYMNINRAENIAVSFDPCDLEDLFGAIDYLYQNQNTRDGLAQNAMIEATQYDDSVIFPKIENLYSEVLSP
jgi:glycosyltransferase involved in cell wall biosynthesis